MIQDKQNILKSFEGKKIDESVHVARWGTINNQDSSRQIFNKYAAMGSSNSPQQSFSQVLQNDNLYNTQQSQVHEIDTGFKKLKDNQISKLKELKQEYEVLRNLNIEQKPSMPNLHNGKVHSQSSSLHQSPSEELLSSSSRHKKSIVRKENLNSREAQILSLQKKQLEMVINNSMKKIEELLHNEMEYKKQLHELKLQVSGRQNVDVEYQAMIKTLKKTQIGQHETIQALKKQLQKQRYSMRQLNQKISQLQSQLMMKQQQIRLLLGQKRKSQDLIRLEKDRYFNLDIDYKKTKMQYELLEKDKNSEINRLMKQLDYAGVNKTKDLELKVKRYEDDIEIKDKRYSVLLSQLEEQKMKYNIQEQELMQLRANSAGGQIDKNQVEEILVNFREKNDSVAFGRQMNDVLQKLQQIDYNQNSYLRQQIQMLKLQLEGFKENQKQQTQSVSVQQYVDRIDELEREIRSENSQKQEIVKRLRRFEREYQDMNRRVNQAQKQVEEYQALESKLREQIRSLKEQNRSLKLKSQSSQNIRPVIVNRDEKLVRGQVEVKYHKELEIVQRNLNETTSKFKQQVEQLENELRTARRLSDENEFKATKASAELEFRLKMQQGEHTSILTRMGEDLQRQKREFLLLKQQYDQYRQTTERKLAQRQNELETLRSRLRQSSQGSQTNVNNIKLQYESMLKTQRQSYRQEIQTLTNQITALSKINEKYLQQTSKYVHYENELSCLRQIMRRSIHLSQGVDHLWRVKETEYQNVSEVLRQVSNWQY